MNGMALLRCICDETRFAILETLGTGGELSVGQIAAALERDQPLVSHHLRILKGCGVLACRADGRRSLYRISSTRISSLIADILEASDRINSLCAEDGCCTPARPGMAPAGKIRAPR